MTRILVIILVIFLSCFFFVLFCFVVLPRSLLCFPFYFPLICLSPSSLCLLCVCARKGGMTQENTLLVGHSDFGYPWVCKLRRGQVIVKPHSVGGLIWQLLKSLMV